jgi:hypothetical protein
LRDCILSSEITRLNKEVSCFPFIVFLYLNYFMKQIATITNAYLRLKFDLTESKNLYQTAQRTISILQSANVVRKPCFSVFCFLHVINSFSPSFRSRPNGKVHRRFSTVSCSNRFFQSSTASRVLQ